MESAAQMVAHQLTQEEEDILVGIVCSWLAKEDRDFCRQHAMQDIASSIKEILSALQLILEQTRNHSSLLLCVVYYADQFVCRYGIHHNQIFNILLVR